MNSTIVSLPPVLFITFYYWFLQISFITSLLLTPFFIYIVFTQSKNLKNYKWYILNYSIWSFGFGAIIGLFKPMLLTPAFSGFPLSGIRENGNYHITFIPTFLEFFIGINYAASLLVTVASRYLTIFPSKLSKWITRKTLTLIALLVLAVLYPLIIAICIPAFLTDSNTIFQEAMSYDDFFKTFNEPSLFFISSKNYKAVLILILIILVIVFIVGILVIIFFQYLVQKNVSASVTKIQRSLIMSSVMQISLSLFFLDLPIVLLIVLVLSEIPNTSIFACICLAILSIHGILEFISTLYFILPYRKFIQSLFRKFSRLPKKFSVHSPSVHVIN